MASSDIITTSSTTSQDKKRKFTADELNTTYILKSKRSNTDDRTFSIVSTDSESSTDLESKLNTKTENTSESESEESNNEESQPRKKQKIEEDQQGLNCTERNLIESDSDKLQSAVIITSFDDPFSVSNEHSIPDLKEHEVLVENKFIGLNPIDWKGLKYRFGVYSFPWIQGRESSGVVYKVGANVKDLKEGDEVFIASTSYRDLRTSTFQKYTAFDSRLVWKLPKNVTLQQGASLGVGLVTAGSVLEELETGVFSDEKEKKTETKSILIWGASSGVGGLVAQFSKIAGFEKIIGVASNKHKDHLFNIGVTHHIDRFLPIEEITAKVKEIVPDGLQIGVDVVGKQTSDHVIDFLNLDQGFEKTFVGVVSRPSGDKIFSNIKIKEVLIKKFHEDIAHGTKLVQKTTKMLTNGQLKPQTNFRTYNGFEGIINGLKDLEKYGASNEKYVVEL